MAKHEEISSDVQNLDIPGNQTITRQEPKIFGVSQGEIWREFVYPYLKKEFKEKAGITEAHTKTDKTNKSPFGRTMGTIKEFMQGTWYLYPLMLGSLGLTIILLYVLFKVLIKLVGI